jgi:hypothetical protein
MAQQRKRDRTELIGATVPGSVVRESKIMAGKMGISFSALVTMALRGALGRWNHSGNDRSASGADLKAVSPKKKRIK